MGDGPTVGMSGDDEREGKCVMWEDESRGMGEDGEDNVIGGTGEQGEECGDAEWFWYIFGRNDGISPSTVCRASLTDSWDDKSDIELVKGKVIVGSTLEWCGGEMGGKV